MTEEIEQNENQNKFSTLLRNTAWVLKLNWRYAPLISTATLLGFIKNYVFGLLGAFIVGLVVDRIVVYIQNPTDQSLVTSSLILFAAYYLLSGLGSVFANYGNNLSSFKLGYELPEMLLAEKLNRLSISDVESPKVQNLVTRFGENRSIFREFTRYMFTVIGALIALIVAIVPLINILPGITILLIVASLPAFWVNRYVINSLWKLDKETTVLNRRGSSIMGILTDPARMKEVKLLNLHSELKKYFDEYVLKYFGKKVKIYNMWSFSDLVNNFLMAGIIILGIHSLITLAGEGIVSVGQITFYFAALTSLTNNIDNFSANFASFMGSGLRLQEARKLLNYPEPKASDKQKMENFIVPPNINLVAVNFAYPNSEKLVIKDLNLEIQPGEKIAIVGENGAGKTTLVKLISNIYPVTSGQIIVNGQNLNDVTEESWFQNLGVLYQDYNTYDDLTAFENIVLGRPEVTEVKYEDVREAARKADADDFIMEYKNDYSQVLSERYDDGIRPSTGQWQKIAIARFFYRNAPILILDEPTASIDAVAEANIFDRIYQFIQNKTVIIISHRFSTVRNADRIIVFDQGQIVEQGSHDELMVLNGKYAHAFNLQAKGYN